MRVDTPRGLAKHFCLGVEQVGDESGQAAELRGANRSDLEPSR